MKNKSLLEEKDIPRLIMFVKSCANNLQSKYKGQYDEMINQKCEDFCKEYNIKITHGSAYKELRHKSYYYLDKYFNTVLSEHKDLYQLRSLHIVSDKDIVDKLFNTNKEE